MITRKIPLTSILKDEKTPFYAVNAGELTNITKKFGNAFKERFPDFIIGYSYKTNNDNKVLRILHDCGCYAEVVSPSEYKQAKKFVDDDKIIYDGVIRDKVNKRKVILGGGYVNVDNEDELRDLDGYVGENGKVGVRLNLGLGESRFGIIPSVLDSIKLKNLKIAYLHCHISGARQLNKWEERAKLMAFYAHKYNIEVVNLGGNMYGDMEENLVKQLKLVAPSYGDYARTIEKAFKEEYKNDKLPNLILEPGTPIISKPECYVSRVTAIKNIRGKWYVFLDGKKLDITILGSGNTKFPSEILRVGKGKPYQVTNAMFFGSTCLEHDEMHCLDDGYTGELSIGDAVVFKNIGSYSNSVGVRFIQDKPKVIIYNK